MLGDGVAVGPEAAVGCGEGGCTDVVGAGVGFGRGMSRFWFGAVSGVLLGVMPLYEDEP